MSINHLRWVTVVFTLCLGVNAWGQEPEADRIAGEVRVEGPQIVHGTLTLSGVNGRNFRAELRGDGTFQLSHIPYGDYRLTVSDDANHPVHEEPVSIRSQGPPLLIQVVRPQAARPPAGGVSAEELLHPPKKQAFKDFLEARKLADRGDHETAARKLEEAVRLSPDYSAAWINLAAQHLFLQHYELALQELDRAASISKPTPTLLANKAYAEFLLHHNAAAVDAAREALQLDPSFAPANYLLGSYLVLDRRTLAAGIRHLEAAAPSMPSAREALERARREALQPVTR